MFGSPTQTTAQQSQPVYYDGKVIQMSFVPGKQELRIGPWKIHGKIDNDHPRDRHPNIYIAAPGTQYLLDGAEQYAHNVIVSAIPSKKEAVGWDLYFAIVLDPTMREDFRSEQQLILATQEEFVVPPEMKIDDVPGAALLKENLHISTLSGLDAYRRANGQLPRLIIVPAKISVKASATDPNAPPETSALPRLPGGVRSSAIRH